MKSFKLIYLLLSFVFTLNMINAAENADPFSAETTVVVTSQKVSEPNSVLKTIKPSETATKANENQKNNTGKPFIIDKLNEKLIELHKNKLQESAQTNVSDSIIGYITDPSANKKLVKIKSADFTIENKSDEADIQNLIRLNSSNKFQTIDGFGFALTGGSAWLISQLSPSDRKVLLEKIYSREKGIGASMVRISIGASDLSRRCFTYDEKLFGKDLQLKKFDIYAGDKELIPILKEILEINPNIRIIATPWTAPKWMKTRRMYRGGSLDPKYYQVYADYFVAYLSAMKNNGIKISAITVQNEPECGTNAPSMKMTSEQQAEFIGKYLGPTLNAKGFGETEILCWDHNCDKSDFASYVMSDNDAEPYVSGSAWHLYAGNINIMSEIHENFPNKKIYLTEQWTGRGGNFSGDFKWHMNNVVLGTLNNYGNAVFEWNLASDQDCDPHTFGGCPDCKGAVTIDKKEEKVLQYNVAYYIIGQASKFIPSGSVRIEAIYPENSDIKTAAFETPKGEKVVIAFNNSSEQKEISIEYESKIYSHVLNSGSAATYVIK